MRFYLIFLLGTKVVGISTYDTEEARASVIERLSGGVGSVVRTVDGFDFDSIQTLNEVT